MLRLASKVALRTMGWKSTGSFPPTLKKYVVIVGPHTSGWDFVIGLLFRKALHLEHVKYLGKQELFKPPFGFFFRWVGGYPVDRSSRHNLVEQVVNVFNRHEEFAIALSPEGTRTRVDKLKTGFYNIAREAGVPLIMVALDYKDKCLTISEPLYLTRDQAIDFSRIHDFFRPVQGKYPENGLMHL